VMEVNPAGAHQLLHTSMLLLAHFQLEPGRDVQFTPLLFPLGQAVYQ